MASLFQESQIKTLKLTNRFMRSATWEGLASDDEFVAMDAEWDFR